MKSNFKVLLSATIFFFAALTSFGQGTVKGKILDEVSNETLIGATILVQGEGTGTVSNLDGSFSFNLDAGSYSLKISYVGYLETIVDVTVHDGQVTELGKIKLASDAIGLQEVMVVSSMAIARKTPVAVSSIKPKFIMEKLGTQEFPEILKSTPGVYATKQGGAFGDSRINLRGFDQRNIAVMINGVPVNDMENGWVYWSNWAGLADVTRYMQVQRGLGASKVAVPSVGGTINIMTKTTDAVKGGSLITGIGNDGYQKLGLNLSSGLNENGWATSFSLARTTGNGYVDGTEFESYSYFANISKRLNEKHSLSFSIFGAPQWHGQRTSDQTIATFDDYGIKYNSDWGYRNGQVEYVRKNYYHKPQAILNHFWTLNENTSVLSALYISTGTGGGTGGYGNASKFYGSNLRDGQVNFDWIVDENIALENAGSETILRSSVNNHKWYGILSTVNHDMGNLKLMGGLDARYYKGIHYRKVTDLLGGEFYVDNSDENNPNQVVGVGDKIAYYNDGLVSWSGVFGQAEYTVGELSAFGAAAFSYQSFKRIDYFSYLDDDPLQETDWNGFFGFSVKGGANYNLSDIHNVFLNTGYFSRQPDFDAVYLNNLNIFNEEAVNETVFSFELGYGLNTRSFVANVNLYYTKWMDKSLTKYVPGIDINGDPADYFTNLLGVDALHQGVEMDFVYKPFSNLDIRGMVSIGDWRWLNNLEDVNTFDDQQNIIRTDNIYMSNIHVGDAAQTSMALGVDWELLEGFKIGSDFNYYDNLFADFDPASRTVSEGGTNPDSWKMPNYALLDLNLRYDFEMAGIKSSFMARVNNLLDEQYMSESRDGSNHDWAGARVYYGWGRSWSVTLLFRF